MSWFKQFPNVFNTTNKTNQVLKNTDNETQAIYDLINQLMSSTTGHAHTGSGDDGKQINGTGINVTVDQTIATATANSGTATQINSWIVKEILAIKGSVTNWYDAAVVSLSAIFGLTWTEKFIMTNPANGFVSPILSVTRNGTGQTFYFYPQGVVASATSIYFFTGSGTITLSGAMTNVSTTMPVSSAITFTGTPYALIDVNGVPEIVKLTGGSGTTSITVVRGQLGTTAVAHNSGGIVLNSNPSNVSISSIAPVSYNASAITANKRDLFAYSVSGTGFGACSVTCVQEWGNR